MDEHSTLTLSVAQVVDHTDDSEATATSLHSSQPAYTTNDYAQVMEYILDNVRTNDNWIRDITKICDGVSDQYSKVEAVSSHMLFQDSGDVNDDDQQSSLRQVQQSATRQQTPDMISQTSRKMEQADQVSTELGIQILIL